MDTSLERRRNKRWSEVLKREIVAATLKPGASVSLVARQYDVNANQVFGWRRWYREASRPSAAPPSTSRIVLVMIVPES
jgi:transposase